ncbi:MAG: SWIM zinc finger family protein [Chloroflexi bacterium]|nr:SWIM zinc finger family protein [Chloroflexota bacterium]
MAASRLVITAAKIHQWVGATYAERGQDYYQNGHVLDFSWRGATLTGRVQGSEYKPYRVTIDFSGGGMYGECTCPMDYNCKHVAAVLFAAASQPPPAPSTPRASRAPTIRKELAALDKPDLIAVIKVMLEDAPELEAVVKSRLSAMRIAKAAGDSADAVAIRRNVVGLIRLAASPRGGKSAQSGLRSFLSQADSFINENQYSAALAVIQAVLSELMLVDSVALGRVESVARSAVESAINCWRAMPADDSGRPDALRLLFDLLAWEIHQSVGVDVERNVESALANGATPEERDQLLEWIAMAIRHAPPDSYADNYEDDYGYSNEGEYDEENIEEDWLPGEWERLQEVLAKKPGRNLKAQTQNSKSEKSRKRSKS